MDISKETTEKTVDQLVANIKDCMRIVCRAAGFGGTTDHRGISRLTISLQRDVDELARRVQEIEKAIAVEQERCVVAVKEWTFGQRKREILKIIRNYEEKED